jgi:hypothetical protein
MLCKIVCASILILLNIFFIGLLIWGSVYLSKSPEPLVECTYLQSMNCELPANLTILENANMEFFYSNGNKIVEAYYYPLITDGCLRVNNCCTDGFNGVIGMWQSLYCLINKQNSSVIDEWYFNPSGPNIVYIAPLMLGIFGIIISNSVCFVNFCCDPCDIFN